MEVNESGVASVSICFLVNVCGWVLVAINDGSRVVMCYPLFVFFGNEECDRWSVTSLGGLYCIGGVAFARGDCCEEGVSVTSWSWK